MARPMNTAALHHIDCEWHHDQYDRECTCGAGGDLSASKVQPCPECDGTGQREVEAERRLTAEREARIREVAELRAQKDAWIAGLETENDRLRRALGTIASQTFLNDPAQSRRIARETLMEKCPTCSGIGVSEKRAARLC
jgi:hypothetical protein